MNEYRNGIHIILLYTAYDNNGVIVPLITPNDEKVYPTHHQYICQWKSFFLQGNPTMHDAEIKKIEQKL